MNKILLAVLTVLLKFGIYSTLAATTTTEKNNQRQRQVWAWASVHANNDGKNNGKEALIAQLQNTTLTNLIDGIQVWCGDCKFQDDGGIYLNETFWEEECMPVVHAANAASVKFQLMIWGAVPDAAIRKPQKSAIGVLRILEKYPNLIDGVSLDDERDCAPRSTTDSFVDWINFQNLFTLYLSEYDYQVTSAVQALFAIEKDSKNNPCKYNPAQYELDTTVSDLLLSSSTSNLQKWLVMDTYYFSTGRFMGALDWYTQNIPLPKLGIGIMNRDDLTEDDIVARFHALHHSNVDWINVFVMPIDDKLLPFLRRWKTYCKGCGKQSLLGCYDLTIECNDDRDDDVIQRIS